MRFIWDEFIYLHEEGVDNHFGFGYNIAYDMICIFDGLSFFALLLSHHKNFRLQNAANELYVSVLSNSLNSNTKESIM